MNGNATLAEGSTVDSLDLPPDDLDEDVQFRTSLQKAKLTTPLTRGLLVLVIAGIGFLGGAIVQQHRQPSSNTGGLGLPAGLRQGFPGALTAPGATNAASTAAAGSSSTGGVSGTVKLVDGTTVYLSDVQGNIVKVRTDGSTKIRVNKDGTLADLGPTKTVTVQGTKNADGTYTAGTISETTSSGLPAGFPANPGG
jgi:hypothetical protein